MSLILKSIVKILDSAGVTTFAWQKCTTALELKHMLFNVAKMYCLCDKMMNC